jgi:hypothetical protein
MKSLVLMNIAGVPGLRASALGGACGAGNGEGAVLLKDDAFEIVVDQEDPERTGVQDA